MITEFEDLYIADLNEEKTVRHRRDTEKIVYCFCLSGGPPHKWQDIFTSEKFKFFGNNVEMATAIMITGALPYTNLSITARERDIEKMKKMADKVIQRTNKKYREQLRQEVKDAEQVSTLRNRLFGKRKR